MQMAYADMTEDQLRDVMIRSYGSQTPEYHENARMANLELDRRINERGNLNGEVSVSGGTDGVSIFVRNWDPHEGELSFAVLDVNAARALVARLNAAIAEAS